MGDYVKGLVSSIYLFTYSKIAMFASSDIFELPKRRIFREGFW